MTKKEENRWVSFIAKQGAVDDMDLAADALGINRSELIKLAIDEFIKNHLLSQVELETA